MKFASILLILSLVVLRTNSQHTDHSNEKDSHIVSNEIGVNEGDGTYKYGFETSNGIKRVEHGSSEGHIEGTSAYVSPEGVEIKTTYIADENGYHAVGEHIPKIPEYIIRALEYIRTHPYVEKDYYTGEFKTPRTPTIPTKSSLNHHFRQ
uniref:Pupal cuticle protein Edg-78E n=1 Tax=Glossina brevipalpis TaxID=37001 RepID=A0A1A9VZQ5_9MUSC